MLTITYRTMRGDVRDIQFISKIETRFDRDGPSLVLFNKQQDPYFSITLKDIDWIHIDVSMR